MAETIGYAIVYAFGGTAATAGTAITIGGVATGLTVGSAIGSAVILAGSIAYSSSQNAKLRRAMNSWSIDQGRSVMSRDPIAPRRLIYGTAKVSGTIVFMHTTGTKNEYLHLVVVLAGHEVADIGDVYFNDELVELSSSVPTGKYAAVARVNKHLGAAGQTADSDLVSETGGLWTTDHKLSGCAYLAIRLKWSPDLFPNGLPTIAAVVRGKKVYDPRTTTTAWSDNPALCVADYLTDDRFGKGVAYARIREADLIEAANICDEGVGIGASTTKTCSVASGNRHIGCADLTGVTPGLAVTGTGIPTDAKIVSVGETGDFFTIDRDPTATGGSVSLVLGDAEKRYTCSGTINADQLPAEVLTDLAGAMAGHIVDTGGLWTIRAGAWRTPVMTLTDADLCGSFSVQPRQSRQDTFNGVKGLYTSPATNWAPADFPAVKNDTYMAEDGDVRLWRDVQYNFTTSPATAQRLAKIELERGRQQITCSGAYMLKAMRLMPGDVVGITRSRLGWSTKYFEVIDWTFQPQGDAIGIALNLRETAEGVWDWADGEETTIDLAPNTSLPDPFSVPTPTGLTATSNAIVQEDGTTLPRMALAWNTPNNIYVEQGGQVAIEFKRAVDSVWTEWAKVRGDLLADQVTGLILGTSYDFRIRFINANGVRGSYSSTATATAAGDVTAPAAPTGLAAIAGTGKSVSLSWNANTEDDFSEYAVYRNTSNTFPGPGGKIAETASNRFVDVNVTLGTAYYYWVIALDRSENASSASSSAGPVTPTASSVSIDTTPPTDPSAAAYLGTSGTYQDANGRTLAYMDIFVWQLPLNAVYQNLLYRKTGGTSDWQIAAQLTNDSAGVNVRVDDLSPGVSYDFATQAFSAYSIPSNIVPIVSVAETQANDTSAPSVPGSTSLASPSSTPIPPLYVSGTQYFGTQVRWTHPTEKDAAFVEVKATATNSDGATDYTWYSPDGGTNGVIRVPISAPPVCNLYCVSLTAGYVRVRSVDQTGNASAWVSVGNANGSAGYAAGGAGGLNVGTTAGTVAAGNDSRFPTGTPMVGSNNLSEITSQSAARASIGAMYGGNNLSDVFNTATACGNIGAMRGANNLSEITSPPTARSNLSLGDMATKNAASLGAIGTGNITGTGVLTWTGGIGMTGGITAGGSCLFGGTLQVTGGYYDSGANKVVGTRGSSVSAAGTGYNASASTGDFTGSDSINLAAYVSDRNAIAAALNDHGARINDLISRLKASTGHGLISG